MSETGCKRTFNNATVEARLKCVKDLFWKKKKIEIIFSFSHSFDFHEDSSLTLVGHKKTFSNSVTKVGHA